MSARRGGMGWCGFLAVLSLAVVFAACAGAAWGASPVSKTITDVLRTPLPSEDLKCTANDTSITVEGATFRYTVDRSTGAITQLVATREETDVVRANQPALWFDDLCLSKGNG
ncbi:MAG: hypothetical protein U9Q79_12550, partial [Candidatus Hydrogenedentes bacterium]|nr:hypothetical protein [Candidatus Hydrogenedentota bacterium]